MTMNGIVFDLDGTLTDPRSGIVGCIKYALGQLAQSYPDDDVLASFIGPPLRVALATLLDTSDRELIEKAVVRYRERYEQSGIYETRVYDGIHGMLERVKQSGVPLFVATSKPAVYAQRIVEHCGLARHFSGVFGPELDGRFDNKAELLGHLLTTADLGAEGAIMVGDRAVDVYAAKANRMRSIGVLWGYGSQSELRGAEPDTVCAAPNEVASYLQAI